MGPAGEVIVVGAGPAGLLIAGDLAAARVRTTVLERRNGVSNLTRAFAVHARTLELLDARGAADELVATGAVVARFQLFGGVELDLSGLPSRFHYLLVTPQYNTERVLRERAEAVGAEIVQGVEVTELRQDADGVELEVRNQDGTIEHRRATYVVAADGVHSTVRRALGLSFPGGAAVRSLMLADVRLSEQPPEVLTVNGAGGAFSFIVPFGDGWYRVIAADRRDQRPDSAPVELEEIRDITRRVLGTDFGMREARWLSRFHSDERQAPRYRVGRVFLAGDAAHVHSPAGGQGMNTGMQDAANLSWKLAAAVRGWSGDGLLDTYEAERHPIGRAVLRSSGFLIRLWLGPAPLRMAGAAIVPGLVRMPAFARRSAQTVSGIGVSYPAKSRDHRLVGKRAPDVALAAGDSQPTRLYEALRSGRFLLVNPRDGVAVAEPWADRVDVVQTVDARQAVLLVRPDGYVAWATEQAEQADPKRRAALQLALEQWCGKSS